MKATFLFFLAISCTALTCGTSYAARSSPAYEQPSSDGASNTVRKARREDRRDGGPSSKQRSDHHVYDENHKHGSASLTGANRPKRLPNSRQHFASGNAVDLHRAGLEKSAGAAKNGIILNETISNALPVRPPTVVRPAVPSLNDTRHRSPNPAVIAGLANSKTGNAGAINGTRVNRKP